MSYISLVLLLLQVSRIQPQDLPASCSKVCKCDEHVQTGLTKVRCEQGGLDDRRLRQILQDLPANMGMLSVVSPKHNPSRFSLTQDLKHFDNLQELTLINAGLHSLGKRVFRHIGQLKKLTVSSNDIDYLTLDAFDGLKDLVYLDLSSNKLGQNHLPTGTFSQLPNLQYLSLAKNNISHFSGSLLSGLKNLLTLNLDGNRLNSSELRSLLSQLPNLRSLNIANCGFTQFEEDTFATVSGIQELSIAGNKVGTIPVNALRPLTLLTNLDMAATNLTTIAPYSFKGMPITRLNLAGNDLGSCHSLEKTSPFHGLQPDSFEGVNVISLDLSYNNYQVFRSKFLGKAMHTVRILHLSGNALKDLNTEQFTGTKLTELHISDIAMNKLPEKFPQDLALLRRLNVSRNSLQHIPYSSAAQLIKLQDLEELDISRCQIKRLDAPMQSLMNRLETTYIDNNPFDCHCHILPIKDFMLLPRNRHRCKMLKLDQIVCASPKSQIGKPVVKVENPPDCAIIFGASSGLTQRSEMGILIAIFCAALLLVAICLALFFYSRTCRKKGTYRTREDSHRHLSGCSSEPDSIPNIDRPPLIAHDHLKERLF